MQDDFWRGANNWSDFFLYVTFLSNFDVYLLQTLQRFSSEPSPHPSRPLHVIASERHLPLSHLKGQNLALIRPRFRVLQAPLGSSLPSLQDTTALQNSYAGRHWPLLHLNEPSGHSANTNREKSRACKLKDWQMYIKRNVYSFRKRTIIIMTIISLEENAKVGPFLCSKNR